jgi:hypothetical protein
MRCGACGTPRGCFLTNEVMEQTDARASSASTMPPENRSKPKLRLCQRSRDASAQPRPPVAAARRSRLSAGLDAHASGRLLTSPAMRAMPAGSVVTVQSLPHLARTSIGRRGPRPRRHRCRHSNCVGPRHGASHQEHDGSTTDDDRRRNRDPRGGADRVGDLLVARVLGLARAHFPFGLNVVRSIRARLLPPSTRYRFGAVSR